MGQPKTHTRCITPQHIIAKNIAIYIAYSGEGRVLRGFEFVQVHVLVLALKPRRHHFELRKKRLIPTEDIAYMVQPKGIIFIAPGSRRAKYFGRIKHATAVHQAIHTPCTQIEHPKKMLFDGVRGTEAVEGIQKN